MEKKSTSSKKTTIDPIENIKQENIQLKNQVHELQLQIHQLKQNISQVQEFSNSFHEIIYETDLEGRILFFNEKAIQLFGLTSDDIIHEFNANNLIIPEDRDRAQSRVKELLEKKRIQPEEYTALNKKGDKFPIRVYNSLVIKEEKPVGFRGIVIDLREEHEEIQRKSRMQKAIIQLITDQELFKKDVPLAFQWINEIAGKAIQVKFCSIWLISESKEELKCVDIYDQIAKTHSHDIILKASHFPRYFKELAKSKLIPANDVLNDPRTNEFNEEYFIPLGISSMLDCAIHLQGKIKGVVCFEHSGPKRIWLQDELAFAVQVSDLIANCLLVHEKRQIELQLFVAQKMESISNLSGGIAHDFNNVLASIMGYANLLELGENDSEKRSYIEEIINTVKQAGDLTQKLLALSRRGKSIIQGFDLNSVIENAMSIIRSNSPSNIKIIPHLRATGTLDGDPGQMNQVIMNLCMNAIEAMPNGGKLSIETHNLQQSDVFFQRHLDLIHVPFIQILIRDTGHGIKPEILNHIFEPFNTTKKNGKVKSLGLGLAIAYGIIRNHDGFIEFETKRNEGTTFHLYLPQGHLPLNPSTVEVTTISKGKVHGKILVVEDMEVLRKMIQDYLLKLGFETIVAMDGEDAIQSYQNHSHEIVGVILDLIMPKLSGKDTFTRLKQINPEVKVLISTGFGKEKDLQELMDSGVKGILQKPYQLDTLALEIKKAFLK